MGAGSRRICRGLQIGSCVCYLAVVIPSLLVSASPQGQSPGQEQLPVFHAERNEVEVVVMVRDGKGQPVSNLKQSDFEIRDNGKRQSIGSFAMQGAAQQQTTPQPTPTQPTAAAASAANTTPEAQRRFVALFFDDVHTAPGDFGRVQKAAEQFVQESLRPEDRVAIFEASENNEVTFTNDQPKLLAAIDALRVRPAKNTSKVTQCPRITDYEAYVIANELDSEALNMVTQRLHDCVCPPPSTGDCPPPEVFKTMADGFVQEASQVQRNASQDLLAALDFTVRVLGTMPGRRMLMLSSSGFISGDLDRDVDRVIDNALRGGVVINSLSAKGLATEVPGGSLAEQRQEGGLVSARAAMYETRQLSAAEQAENVAMTDFAESTGGKFFKNNNDFLRGLNELAAPEAAYVLTFSPHSLKHDGKFHNLKVEVKTAGHFRVYARKGYFAPSDKEAKTEHAGAASASPAAAAEANPPALLESKAPAAGEMQPVPSEAAPPSPQPGPAASASSSSTGTKPPSAETAAELASERSFLNLASREVEHYIEAFVDLTAAESRAMQSFDDKGFPARKRSIQSALVVYRLRNDPKGVFEYREVISIDGHEVKEHAARAAKLWREVSEAHSAGEEVKRLRADSERYDIGLEETGLTLFEGLPLRARCAGDFVFREEHREIANGRPVRVFAYQQVHPCNVISYHFALPAEFADSPLFHAGELRLDAESGQVVREERNVYIGSPGKASPRVAHIILSYNESRFGVLVPKTIEAETFFPRVNRNLTYTTFLPYASTLLTYGSFSRFEVSVGDKVSAPVR
jgi:VWFA-related protein